MRIIVRKHGFEIGLYPDELRVIHQALNEVYHGLVLANLEKIIGDPAIAEAEMIRLRVAYENANKGEQPFLYAASDAQVRLYHNALREVCQQIENWEFETRMGTSREKVIELSDQLWDALKGT